MDKKILVTRSSMPSYEEYITAIKPLWDTHWLTNMGVYHKQLEAELRDYLGVDGLSLMVNGHMSLELAIQSFGFPEDSEIITTPFTFISTTHAIVRNKLQPVFCDIKRTDGTIDETKITDLITEKTVAILPVHVFGNVCNIPAIKNIAEQYGLKVIYDAAHSFGVRYNNKGIGSYGDASIFSFHATKVFNTIEGGAVTFSDPKIYEKLYNLKNFGIHGEELVTDIGANAKMNEFCAIMGLCNLKHIDNAIANRKIRYDLYRTELANIKGIELFTPSNNQTLNYAYFPIIINEHSKISRDNLYQLMRNYNIYPRKYFYPLTADEACFKNKYKHVDLSCARDISRNILLLPLYENLALDDIKEIIRIISNEV